MYIPWRAIWYCHQGYRLANYFIMQMKYINYYILKQQAYLQRRDMMRYIGLY